MLILKFCENNVLNINFALNINAFIAIIIEVSENKNFLPDMNC